MTVSFDSGSITTAALSRIVLGAVFLLIFVLPSKGYPGQWRVAPVRIHLDRQARSSVVTVVNEGEDTIHLQGKAMEWSQDPEGKDVFQETGDLIFFPRILMLKKGEQKIIRTGIRVPATSREKTYRLFIEEIPQPKKDTSGATQLTVAIRFGIPVFVKPLKEEPAAELTSLKLTKGNLSAVVGNTGNVHFRITEIAVKGKNGKGEETFSEKLNGWYLLAGAARFYSTPIPAGKCASTEQLDITVSTDTKITLNRQLNVDKTQCLP
jgi:fimbrial chaperone protein